MNTETSSQLALRSAIIEDTIRFLVGLKSGASTEQLTALLAEIKEKELQLFKENGSMLSPVMWQTLHNRLAKRNNDIIDTTS
jgi:hypothetical protein